jgi:site-specific recombinase XerD
MHLNEAIDQFLEYLEIEKDCSPLTIQVYKRYLNRFSRWLTETNPEVKPQDITLEHIRKYRLYLARLTGQSGLPLKKITQNYHVIALRALLRYLSSQRDIAVLSPDKIELPKSGSRTVTFLNSEQVERLLNCPDTSKITGLRDRAILETLFSTGLRISELVKLNRDQINLERKEFGIVGKGNKPRVVFLSDTATEWIEHYLQSREDYFKPLFIRYSGHIDSTRDGEKMRLTPRSVQLSVARYARICGLPFDTTPHTLRHSFATDLLIAGADIRSVQEMLGHESIRTTQVYTHVTDRQLREVHKTFHGRNKGAKPAEE